MYLVDDHDMVRTGLGVFLETCDDLILVGETNNATTAIKEIEELKPEVVLMDLIMPGMNGIQAIKELRKKQKNTQFLALTSFNEKELIYEAINAGAIGFVLKNVSIDELAEAIRSAAAGKPSLNAEALQALIEVPIKKNKFQPDYNLTEREKDVLALIASGFNNQEIATQLVIGVSTVKTHVSNILSKMDVNNRAEAASIATEKHLFTPMDELTHPPLDG